MATVQPIPPRTPLALTHRAELLDYKAVTIEKLNGLSIEALYALADKVGLDLPEGLEPVFVVSELIEAFNEDTKERRLSGSTAVHVEEKKFSGSELDEIDASLDVAACIEARYNETVLHCLIRDPGWAFVFWDVRDQEYDELSSQPGFAGFCLRITENPGRQDAMQFDVSVGRTDCSWYLHLPQPDTWYTIELMARLGSAMRSLSQAKPVRTPRALLPACLEAMDEFSAEMATLSGIHELDMLPQDDRHSPRIMDDYNA